MNEEMKKLFESAPEEMKQATRNYQAAIRRVRKAEDQRRLWQSEEATALALLRTEERVYGEVTMRWDPDSNTMKSALEELKQ